MIRLATLLVLPLALWLGPPAAASADPVLKPAATVKGPIIHLGDIFDGVGSRGSVGIAEAPPPGSKTIFGAGWLAALARQQHLDWEPSSGLDQVTVERDSVVIGADEIVAQLKTALASRAPLDDAEMRLDSSNLHLVIASEAAPTLVFGALSYDPVSGRFGANVSIAEGGSVPDQLRVSGEIVRFTQVPTPTRLIAPGEVIGESDLVPVRLRTDRLGPGALTQVSDLVGKTPKRALRPGEAVHVSDIEIPIVVHRNTLVTIVLETPTLRLTAEGKATEDGGMGAVIRVANTKSNRVIDATVTGPNMVQVQNPL
jgi:flagellar basal body P-ring formation protein FlgA